MTPSAFLYELYAFFSEVVPLILDPLVSDTAVDSYPLVSLLTYSLGFFSLSLVLVIPFVALVKGFKFLSTWRLY